MKISVVIAAYCGEKYIVEQLESLAAQTMPPDEVLIGDDSPDDGVSEKVKCFLNTYSTLPFLLKYVRNPEQKGVNGNFYSLACDCSGDIIFFCDQDDVWLPEKISILAGEFENNPELDAVCCFSTFTDAVLKPWEKQDESELTISQGVSCDRLFYLFAKNAVSGAGHNIAIRKRVLKQLPVWDEYFLYDSWMLRCCAMCGTLRFVPERLTLHRVHGENLTIHPEVNFSRTVMTRMNSNGNAELTRLLTEWMLVRKNLELSSLAEKVLPSNKKMLDKCIAYLQKRLRYRSLSLLFRCVGCVSLLPAYFLFGNGLRSAARDIFRL